MKYVFWKFLKQILWKSPQGVWELSSVILCFLHYFLENTMFQFLSRAAEEGENHPNVRKNILRLGVVCYVGEVMFKVCT